MSENEARLAAAKEEHARRLELLAAANEVKLEQAHAEHRAQCEKAEVEHVAAVAQATQEFEELRAFLQAHNEAMLDEARAKFADAVRAAQAAHAARCDELRRAHEEELAVVRAHNQAIWPQVMVARLAQAELGRVMVSRSGCCPGPLESFLDTLAGLHAFSPVRLRAPCGPVAGLCRAHSILRQQAAAGRQLFARHAKLRPRGGDAGAQRGAGQVSV